MNRRSWDEGGIPTSGGADLSSATPRRRHRPGRKPSRSQPVTGDRYGASDPRRCLEDHGCRPDLPRGSEQVGMEARAGASPHVNVGCRAGAGSWAPVEPQMWEAPVEPNRTSVGLDVHARSVVGCGLDGQTWEPFERRLPGRDLLAARHNGSQTDHRGARRTACPAPRRPARQGRARAASLAGGRGTSPSRRAARLAAPPADACEGGRYARSGPLIAHSLRRNTR